LFALCWKRVASRATIITHNARYRVMVLLKRVGCRTRFQRFSSSRYMASMPWGDGARITVEAYRYCSVLIIRNDTKWNGFFHWQKKCRRLVAQWWPGPVKTCFLWCQLKLQVRFRPTGSHMYPIAVPQLRRSPRAALSHLPCTSSKNRKAHFEEKSLSVIDFISFVAHKCRSSYLQTQWQIDHIKDDVASWETRCLIAAETCSCSPQSSLQDMGPRRNPEAKRTGSSFFPLATNSNECFCAWMQCSNSTAGQSF